MAHDDRDLEGVGGWLGCFVIGTAVLTPIGVVLFTVFSLYGSTLTARDYGDLWSTIQLFEWGLTAATIAGAWFVAYRLLVVHNQASVRIAIAGIWLLGFGAVIVDFVGISLITGAPLGLLFEAAMSEGPAWELIRPLIFAVLWTAYFLRSRRVALTYPRRAGGEKAGQPAA